MNSKYRFLIISAGTPNLEYQYSLTNQNKDAYCKLHGYKYMFIPLEENTPDSHFIRQDLLLTCMNNEDVEYIVWMDCDAWFHNFDKTFDQIVDKYPNKSLICARDNEKGNIPKFYHDNYINSGVLIFKNNEISRQIIELWKNPNDDLMYWMRANTVLHDQPYLCIRLLCDEFTRANSKIVWPQDLNKFAWNGYDEETFIIHYPGSTERKEEGKRRFLEPVVQNMRLN